MTRAPATPLATAAFERAHCRLDAWIVSRELVRRIYRLTQTFPKAELFGLTAQLRRAAVSIPSNIAEGAARTGEKQFVHFLSITRGSVSELETQLIIASDLEYIRADDSIFELVDRVSRLVTGLHKAVKREE